MAIDDHDADRLASIAVQLAGRVRDYDPDANAIWLAAVLPDPEDWFRLTFVLAAAVPDDRSWKHLTAWAVARTDAVEPEPVAEPPAPVEPCGYKTTTDSGARRHRLAGQPVCEPCGESERVYNRQRSADKRSRTSEQTAA